MVVARTTLAMAAADAPSTSPAAINSLPRLPVLRSLGGCGGTLVARVLAAVGHVAVLSETNPRSAALYHARLNPLTQIREWYPALAASVAEFDEHEIGYPPMFGQMVERVYRSAMEQGMQLAIRDYNYVDFVGVPFICPPPMNLSLDEALAGRFAPAPIVLVRHPAAQFRSLKKHRAVQNVLTAERFLQGSRAFLEATRGTPRFRYEDLTDDPKLVFPQICATLGVPWDAAALETFASDTRATGNLARAGESEIRAPAKSDETLRAEQELERLDNYQVLLRELGYQ